MSGQPPHGAVPRIAGFRLHRHPPPEPAEPIQDSLGPADPADGRGCHLGYGPGRHGHGRAAGRAEAWATTVSPTSGAPWPAAARSFQHWSGAPSDFRPALPGAAAPSPLPPATGSWRPRPRGSSRSVRFSPSVLRTRRVPFAASVGPIARASKLHPNGEPTATGRRRPWPRGPSPAPEMSGARRRCSPRPRCAGLGSSMRPHTGTLAGLRDRALSVSDALQLPAGDRGHRHAAPGLLPAGEPGVAPAARAGRQAPRRFGAPPGGRGARRPPSRRRGSPSRRRRCSSASTRRVGG